jgi:hypothetical protein
LDDGEASRQIILSVEPLTKISDIMTLSFVTAQSTLPGCVIVIDSQQVGFFGGQKRRVHHYYSAANPVLCEIFC